MPAEAVRDAAPLAGTAVLVTRPARQAVRLSLQLERLGASVLRFPLVRIGPPVDPNLAQSRLAELGRAHLVIFVSANAVRFAFELLPEFASHIEGVTLACPGDATSSALRLSGLEVQLVPRRGTTSEALLAMEELQAAAISGRAVAIVKGEGGRDLLENALEERGARVIAIDVYRRELPAGDLPAFLDEHAGALTMAVITSGEALAHFARLGGIERVRALPLVLPSDRVLEQAVALGFAGPFSVPARMSDAGLAQAAVRLRGTLDH